MKEVILALWVHEEIKEKKVQKDLRVILDTKVFFHLVLLLGERFGIFFSVSRFLGVAMLRVSREAQGRA